MAATIERITSPTSFILRLGPNHLKYGDPWNLMAVVEQFGSLAVIEAASGTLKDIPAIRKALRPLGIKTVKYYRYKEGAKIEHTIEVGDE